MGLPALTTELPERFREDLARLNLALVEREATEKLRVVVATDEAAEAILISNIEDAPDYAERIAGLSRVETDETTSMTMAEAVQRIAGTTQKHKAGISDKRVARDLLAELHPDRVSGTQDSVNPIEEDLVKELTTAKKADDKPKVQLRYAQGMAQRHTRAEATTSMLEDAYYKSFVALNSVDSRFGSVEEVDAWRDDQIARLPFQRRVHILVGLTKVTEPSIGNRIGSSLQMTPEVYEAFEPYVMTLRRLGESTDDGTPLSEIEGADIEGFDELAEAYISGLEDKMQPASTLSIDDIVMRSVRYSAIALVRKLHELARKLDTQPIYASLSMSLGRLALGTESPPLSRDKGEVFMREQSSRYKDSHYKNYNRFINEDLNKNY
ncbi:hypothetical protein KDA00_01830 [Candidatus Saccharibacteria bacterium]|nr:hypothetical protein [Candidatus Saccharibacteria bacterium]